MPTGVIVFLVVAGIVWLIFNLILKASTEAEKEKIEDEQQYINQSKLNKEMKRAEKKQQIIEKGKTYPEFHEKTIFENVNLNDMYDKDSTYAQTIFKHPISISIKFCHPLSLQRFRYFIRASYNLTKINYFISLNKC